MYKGFAYFSKGHGGIDVATVSPTKRGAMVNALVRVYGTPIFASHSDEEIEKLFEFCAAKNPTNAAQIVEVSITVVG